MPARLRHFILRLVAAALAVLGVAGGAGIAAAHAVDNAGCGPGVDILQTYAALGGASSRLGGCTGPEVGVARGGAAQFFQGGSIYWSTASGAHSLVGGIQAHYAADGWENSALAFPITEAFGPLARGGFGQHFEGGSIYWTPEHGAVSVKGALRERWASLGWEKSWLGYPVRAEVALSTDGGYLQQFEGGSIYWSPTTGAHAVRGAIQATWGAHGWEWGDLGYPLSEEYDVTRVVGSGGSGPGVPVDKRSDFQFGNISWEAASGRTSVNITGTRPPRVSVIGDSLTFGACGGTAQHVSERAGFRGVACFGWPGATSDELAAYVQDPWFRSAWPNMLRPMPGVDLRAAVAGSDVLVVGLGTNDALRDRAAYDWHIWPRNDVAPVPSGHVPVDNGYFDQKIDAFMQLAAGRPVYWYDLGYAGRDRATAYYFSHRNERLQAATRRWPNLRILPWAAAVAANPAMMTDEVHVSSVGNDVRWDLLRTAMAR